MNRIKVIQFSGSIIGLLLPLSLSGAAQESEKSVKMKDLPPAVQQTVLEQSRGTKIRGLSKETEDGTNFFYEMTIRVNGQTRDVLIDPNGTVVEVEETTSLAALPQLVRDEFQRQAANGKIRKVESVSRGGQIVFYEAEIRVAGKTTEVQVDPGGKVIKTES
jgi:hypothetical protein